MKREFTLAEFIDAIEKNGFTQTEGYFFKDETGIGASLPRGPMTIKSACAVGQAAINLSVSPVDMMWKDDDITESFGWVRGTIESWNDDRYMAIPEIVKNAREQYKDHLDRVIVADEFDYTPFLEK